MLTFYKDEALTYPISSAFPFSFMFPLGGGTHTYTLYLADTFHTALSAGISSGASTIDLYDTSEFLDAGTATINGNSFTYTGKTQSTLTGCSGISSDYLTGAIVQPSKVYKAAQNIGIYYAPGNTTGLQVSLRPNTSVQFGFPGMPTFLAQVTIASGASVPVYVRVAVPEGGTQEFASWGITTDTFYFRDASNASTAIATTDGVITEFGTRIYAPGYVTQAEQSPIIMARLIEASRALASSFPGFVVGKYLWRDNTTINAVALTPPNWNILPATIGTEKFIPGIGYGTDLNLVDVEQSGDSINPRIQAGEYFTGVNRYYLPASSVSVVINGSGGSISCTLPSTPVPQTPIYVGTFQQDTEGYFDQNTRYEYVGTTLNPDGSPRTDLPEFYYTVNRATNVITLNTGITAVDLYIGNISGQLTDTFFLPVYPVYQVLSVYSIDSEGVSQYSSDYSYNSTTNYIQITGTGTGPSIPGTVVGAPIYATYNPGILIQYDAGTSDSTILPPVELNPAFSGVANGYLYLEHRKQSPATITLDCDKPRILVPSSQNSLVPLTAYGPVYYKNDYALLTATAYSLVPGETVAGTKLLVIPGPNWVGLINYIDPVANQIILTTGGDGSANFVYTPNSQLGYFIPTSAGTETLGPLDLVAGIATTNITGDTLVLPVPVPISQVYNLLDGWYVTLYQVYNNDPLYGMVGATGSEIPWSTSGTAGTANYSTNGAKIPWGTTFTGSNVITPIYPASALDENGVNFNQVGFTGYVTKLVYSSAIPTDTTIGSYYVTFDAVVTLYVQSIDNPDIDSNTVLLEIQVPPLLNQNPWLQLNDLIQGVLNQNRLGFVP